MARRVCPFWVGYGHDRVKDYWQAFSPMQNISEQAPPTVVMLGTEDNLVPVETARKYKRLMEAEGARCDLHLYDGQKHGFFNFANTDNYNRTVADMDRFLDSLGYLDRRKAFSTPERDKLWLRVPTENPDLLTCPLKVL